VRFALWVPNFGALADVSLLAELAARSEAAGWDGWFLQDHIVHQRGTEPTVDPWMALAVAAQATSRIRLGPLVTPLPRRRPWNVAREAATLDRLSGGRAVLGVGIGSDRTREYREFGEATDLARRAAMLDEGLDLLAALWTGSTVHHAGAHYQLGGVRFAPTPVQKPLPVWVAAIWPHRRPFRRARRWQGVFPLGLPGPEAVADIAGTVGHDTDIVVVGDDHPAAEWAAAGAAWWLQRVEPDEPVDDLVALVDAGPPRASATARGVSRSTRPRPARRASSA
jgi:alkanesulfonate monooxygenase SsuD/methylene tetrahydromethanopterin reductase-like flavin-dependent oxidoreductase (luciferase family)